MNFFQSIKHSLQPALHALTKNPIYEKIGEPAWRSFLNLLRMFRVALEKFNKDTCTIRSSSIAYAIAISVIPILTIVVRFAAVDRITIRANLASFLAANGMADSTELLSILDEILGRANQIAGIGILFMLYSATNLIRNLEDAYNHIFRAREQRPLLYRFALYIAAFAIIPTLIVFSAGIARLALSKLQPAQPTALAMFSGKKWLLYESGELWKNIDQKKIEKIDLFERSNTGEKFRDIFIDENNRRVGTAWEIVGQDFVNPPLTRQDLYDTKWILASKDTLYVVNDQGLILHSEDQGHTWSFHRIHFKLTEVYEPEVRDAFVSADNELILLVSINSRTGLVRHKPGATWSYKRLDGVYNRLFSITNITDPKAPFQNGLYLTGKGVYRYSADLGQSWTPPQVVLFGNRKLYFKSLQATPDGTMYFAASSGELWFQKNGKNTTLNTRADAPGTRTRGFALLPNGAALSYSNHEGFRYSFDGGQNWLRPKNKLLAEMDFAVHLSTPNGILLASDNQSLIQISQAKMSQERDEQGYPYAVFQIKKLYKLPLWFTVLGKTLVNLFILVVCFLIFLGAYKAVPNTPVQWKAAAGGSLFTSITLLSFFIIFRLWVTGFTTTGYIYGVWAAIPLGMLIILTSTQIILFGLELAYVIQHPVLYQKSRRTSLQRDSLLWSCLTLLSLIYHRLYGENSPLTDESAVHYFGDRLGRLDYIRETLLEGKWISYNEISGEYYPTKPASSIKMDELQAFLIEHSLRIPTKFVHLDKEKETLLSPTFEDRLQKILSTIETRDKRVTMADLLPVMVDWQKRN